MTENSLFITLFKSCPLSVKGATMEAVIISHRQAKEFARMIYRDIRQFVEEHREEYEAFLLEEEAKENVTRSDRKNIP